MIAPLSARRQAAAGFHFAVSIALWIVDPVIAGDGAHHAGHVDPCFRVNAGPNIMGAVRGLAAVSRSDGKLYVELEGSEGGSALLRLDPGGSTDPEFVAEQEGRPLVVAADGGVICRPRSDFYSIELFRLDPRGRLDKEFQVSVAHFCCGGLMAVASQPDGRLIVAGQFESINGVPRRNIARLNADSTVDQSFDAGKSSSRWIWRVAIQGDGKIIIAGEFKTVAGLPRAAIARLHTNGVVDETFVSNANPPTIFGGSSHGGTTALVVEPDGNILWSLQGGWTLPDSGIKSVVRLRSDGSLDTTFRPGNSLNAADGAEPWIESIAVQADRKIVLAGGFGPAGVARFLPDGSPDAGRQIDHSGTLSELWRRTACGHRIAVHGTKSTVPNHQH
jgi:uncharacterized delta-60 repeat protein